MERCSHLISAKLTDSAWRHYAKALKHREGSRMVSEAITYYHGENGPRMARKKEMEYQSTILELHKNIQGMQLAMVHYAERAKKAEEE